MGRGASDQSDPSNVIIRGTKQAVQVGLRELSETSVSGLSYQDRVSARFERVDRFVVFVPINNDA